MTVWKQISASGAPSTLARNALFCSAAQRRPADRGPRATRARQRQRIRGVISGHFLVRVWPPPGSLPRWARTGAFGRHRPGSRIAMKERGAREAVADLSPSATTTGDGPLAWIRRRVFGTGFLRSFISVTLGGAIIVIISVALGAVG